MEGWTLGLGTVILVVLGLLVGALVVLGAVYLAVRAVLARATHRVLDRTIDQVVKAGERQLVAGVSSLSSSVKEEMRRNDPRRQEADISKLARQHQGRVTVADVMASLDLPQDTASRTLEGLVKRGACRPVQDEASGTVYLFEAFLPRRQVTACDYCSATFQETDPDQPCPNCGATLTRKQIVD